MPLHPAFSGLSQDEALLVQTARDFAEGELLALDRRWDREESDVSEALPRLEEMGLLSLMAPQALDGLECSYRAYTSIIHEISEFSPSTAVTIAVHNMAARIVSRFMIHGLHSEQLRSLCRADNLLAFALSEAGAGSDGKAIRTTAVKTPQGFRINGEKMWITNGISARWFLTLVRLEGAAMDQSFCAFLIDGQSKKISRDRIRGKMGIRGSETAVIHFHDVEVTEGALVGRMGDGLRVFLSTLNDGRVGIAAQATGIAEACVKMMTSYARQREQFGQPIGKFQAVSNMIADSAMELEAAKSLTWRAACAIDAQRSDRTECSEAKLYASEATNRIAYRAVQVHGGTGYVNESRVEQLFRDARVTTIYEGTSEVQRMVIAEELKKRA